jgi:hypothetical protein
MRCDSCFFYNEVDGVNAGTCHLSPPQSMRSEQPSDLDHHMAIGAWPEVRATDWCGGWLSGKDVPPGGLPTNRTGGFASSVVSSLTASYIWTQYLEQYVPTFHLPGVLGAAINSSLGDPGLALQRFREARQSGYRVSVTDPSGRELEILPLSAPQVGLNDFGVTAPDETEQKFQQAIASGNTVVATAHDGTQIVLYRSIAKPEGTSTPATE